MPADDVSAAISVSMISVAWTVMTSALAVVFGLVSSSLVLLAFGLTGTIDAAGSWALALHFRHVRHHDEISPQRERRAHMIISVGLIVVGSAAVAESVHRLITSRGSERSVIGALIAGASVVALGILATVKHRVARRLQSAPLRSDGNLSATGALLGIVAVVCTALHGVTWLDPTCALVIGVVASASGLYSLRTGP